MVPQALALVVAAAQFHAVSAPNIATQSMQSWAGYELQHHVTAETGSFTVPQVANAPGSALAIWSGIDGDGYTDILQAGVYASPGAPQAFWAVEDDSTPLTVHVIPLAVARGDHIATTIARTAPGTWQVSLTNTTTGQTFTTQTAYTGPRDSAEWIAEAPRRSYDPADASSYPLTPFAPITWTGVMVDGPAPSTDVLTDAINRRTRTTPLRAGSFTTSSLAWH